MFFNGDAFAQGKGGSNGKPSSAIDQGGGNTGTGGTAVTTDSETGKVVEEDLSATYLWKYEKDRTRVRNFNNAIEALITDTGLEQRVAIQAMDDEHLGYSQIKFEFKMNKPYVQKLMRQVNTRNGLRSIQRKSMNDLKTYLRNGDKYDLCPAFDYDKKEACIRQLKYETKRAFGKIKKWLDRMNSLRGNDSKEFTKAFARVGKWMMTNQFTLKPFIKKAEVCGGELGYEVSGARISRVTNFEEWEHSVQGCKF